MSEQRMTKDLLVQDGWICEAGCIDMGLSRGNPRAIGAVIEVGDRKGDIEIRGITKNASVELAKHVRSRVRIRIELLGEGDE